MDGGRWFAERLPVNEHFARLAEVARVARVNGALGIVSWLPGGRPLAVMGFTVRRGRIVEIDILADPRASAGWT